jgi:hypothetical protein
MALIPPRKGRMAKGFSDLKLKNMASFSVDLWKIRDIVGTRRGKKPRTNYALALATLLYPRYAGEEYLHIH